MSARHSSPKLIDNKDFRKLIKKFRFRLLSKKKSNNAIR